MSNEELKQNLTSPNQWVRLIYMVLFAVLLEIAGFVMLAVIIAQFLFAIFTGGANDNLRRLGDQIASFIYQTLQFLIYNSEEKPFPFSEWPESEEEDLSSYASAEEIDGEVIGADPAAQDAADEAEEEIVAESVATDGESTASAKKASEKPASSGDSKPVEPTKGAKQPKKSGQGSETESVIELGSDRSDTDKSSGDK